MVGMATLVANERSTLLIRNGTMAEELAARTERCLEDPHKREDGESKGGPVDDAGSNISIVD
jgi:hypothetical protein